MEPVGLGTAILHSRCHSYSYKMCSYFDIRLLHRIISSYTTRV